MNTREERSGYSPNSPESSLSTLEDWLGRRRALIERAIRQWMPAPEGSDLAAPVIRAMEAAVGGEAKRVRAALALEVGLALSAEEKELSPLLAALEMLHAASLVLDDLPSMDDAETRRGKPTLHRTFGEATAILAADALLMQAFEVLATGVSARSGAVAARLVAEAARAVGVRGMIGGQFADLERLPAGADAALVQQVHLHKTAPLFEFAARGAAWIAQAAPERCEAAGRLGRSLGLLFQRVDDWLDAFASAEEIGKDVRMDAGKASMVAILGTQGARAEILELAAEAKAAAAALDPATPSLFELIDRVVARVR